MDDIIRMKKSSKKCETNVAISGTCVIVFGLWSVIKFLISLVYGAENPTEKLKEAIGEDVEDILVIIIIYAIIAATILMIHLFIGLQARKFARGAWKKWFFLVVAAFWAVFTLSAIPSYFASQETGAFDLSKVQDETIAAALVDLALVYMLIDMEVSAIRLKVLRKKLKEQEA